MDSQGYVYVLINPSMDGLVKIGKTTKTPTERAKELSVATGVPTPFIVVYDCYFENCSKAELFVHTYLEEKGFRVSRNREFFEIPVKEAIDAVMEAESSLGKFDIDKNSYQEDDENIEPWNDLVEKAEGYLYGFGNYIQDYGDAIKYYLKAIKLGYIEGYEDIANIYNHNMEDSKKAFLYYKEGAEKGCGSCYAGMGHYYLYEENNLDKAFKSFSLYMKYTPDEDLMYLDICYYLMLAIKDVVDNDKTDFEYFEKTLPYKEDVLKYFKENHIHLPVYYKSIFHIPEESRENIIREYKRHNRDYMDVSYFGLFEATENFFNYIELIYSSGYKSPKDVDGVFFRADVNEVK